MSIFKKGDRVFHITKGWGTVEHINNERELGVLVSFDSRCINTFTQDGKEFQTSLHSTLSFTEYTLQGFSQERPIVLPEIGELCLFRNFDCDDWLVRNFKQITLDTPRRYITTSNNIYRQMKRIKILD